MAASSGPAAAQRADVAALQKLQATSFYAGLITRALAMEPPAVFTKCGTLQAHGSTITIMRPLTFAGDGFPTQGVWKQNFPVSGCGNDTTLHFYFIATAQEKVNTMVGVPGDTHADPILQRDALTYARIGAGTQAHDCKNFDVTNTKFEQFGVAYPPMPDPGPATRLRPWWETWTMEGCGRLFDVPMDFVPNATGTQIIQPVKRITLR
jgi:hypothetical protein